MSEDALVSISFLPLYGVVAMYVSVRCKSAQHTQRAQTTHRHENTNTNNILLIRVRDVAFGAAGTTREQALDDDSRSHLRTRSLNSRSSMVPSS